MRIFLAGASGVIGRHLVPLLVGEGHTVAGMTRTPGKVDWLRDVGAEPIVCDVFERDTLLRVMADFSPELVVHQLTDLPNDPAEVRKQALANRRMRREGTTNLVDAASTCGARMIAQSIAWSLPGDDAKAVEFLERTVLGAGGVVVRYGQFYGPDTYYQDAPPSPPRIRIDEAARLTVISLGVQSGIVDVFESMEA